MGFLHYKSWSCSLWHCVLMMFLIQCPLSWPSHVLAWLHALGMVALKFYSSSRWKCKEFEMEMGLMAYPWSQWLRMKTQMTWQSGPLIRILSGTVFLKDTSLSHIFSCTEQSVFEGKQAVIFVLKQRSFWYIYGRCKRTSFKDQKFKEQGARLPNISITKHVSFYPSHYFSCL